MLLHRFYGHSLGNLGGTAQGIQIHSQSYRLSDYRSNLRRQMPRGSKPSPRQ